MMLRVVLKGMVFPGVINKSISRGLFSVFGIITKDLIEGKLACLKTRHAHTLAVLPRGCMGIP